MAMEAGQTTDDVLVYDVADLKRVLNVGRPVAYRLAKQLGRRLGRRFVVSRAVLETWLAGGTNQTQAPSRRRPSKA
jgi:hypothetical protein